LPAYWKATNANARSLEDHDAALIQILLKRWQIRSKQSHLLIRPPLDSSSEEDY
jgi:hypothetical protein